MTETRRPRAVIADDESHIRTLMKTALTSMNCEVVAEASNGAEALDAYREYKPDLMLLDINMPVTNGEEALAGILAEFPKAFVIMLTSVSDADTVHRCLEQGAAFYIRKDTPIKEIKQLIRESWSNR